MDGCLCATIRSAPGAQTALWLRWAPPGQEVGRAQCSRMGGERASFVTTEANEQAARQPLETEVSLPQLENATSPQCLKSVLLHCHPFHQVAVTGTG